MQLTIAGGVGASTSALALYVRSTTAFNKPTRARGRESSSLPCCSSHVQLSSV